MRGHVWKVGKWTSASVTRQLSAIGAGSHGSMHISCQHSAVSHQLGAVHVRRGPLSAISHGNSCRSVTARGHSSLDFPTVAKYTNRRRARCSTQSSAVMPKGVEHRRAAARLVGLAGWFRLPVVLSQVPSVESPTSGEVNVN